MQDYLLCTERRIEQIVSHGEETALTLGPYPNVIIFEYKPGAERTNSGRFSHRSGLQKSKVNQYQWRSWFSSHPLEFMSVFTPNTLRQVQSFDSDMNIFPSSYLDASRMWLFDSLPISIFPTHRARNRYRIVLQSDSDGWMYWRNETKDFSTDVL